MNDLDGKTKLSLVEAFVKWATLAREAGSLEKPRFFTNTQYFHLNSTIEDLTVYSYRGYFVVTFFSVRACGCASLHERGDAQPCVSTATPSKSPASPNNAQDTYTQTGNRQVYSVPQNRSSRWYPAPKFWYWQVPPPGWAHNAIQAP